MNQDDRLDAGDALLMTRIVEGSLPETSTYQARGDIALLELAPETPSDLNAGDLVLLLRAGAGDDVDGDGVAANAELEVGASPFRKDTDRDGVTDDVEILRGSDPSQGDTDQDGFGDATDTDPVRGVVFWYGDQLGSTTLRTKSDGVLLERVVYRPYGEAIQVAGGAASPPEFGYTGQRFEKSVGIYDYGARWYDPALGRFLQADSIVPSPTNPQSLNRYAYVLNNPINRVDPSGNMSVSGIFGGIASFASDAFSPVRNFASGFASSVGYNLGLTPPPSGSGPGFGTGAAAGSMLGFVGGLAVNAAAIPLRIGGGAIGSIPFFGGGLGSAISAIGNGLGRFGGGLSERSMEGFGLESRAAAWASNLSWGLPNTAVGVGYAALNATLGTALSPLPGISRPSFGFGSPSGEASTRGRFFSVEGGLQDVFGGAVSLGAIASFERGISDRTAYPGHGGVLVGPHEGGHVEQSAVLGPLYLPAVLLSYGAGAGFSPFFDPGRTSIERDASNRALSR